MLERRERVRALFAEQIQAPVDNVALTESTTQGVHVAVIGLGLGPGDEVVTTDAEHFGLTGPLVASGATLRVAKVRDAPAADVYDLIEREVTPRTRLIATSAVSWIDGKVFPWHALRDATQVPVLVDGAQSVGAIEVDVDGRRLLHRERPEVAVRARTRPAPSSSPTRSRCRRGSSPTRARRRTTSPPATWVPKAGARRFDTGLHAAELDRRARGCASNLPAGRFERARELTERCRKLLLEHGHDVVTEPGQATLVSWRHDGDTEAAARQLYERGVIIRELPGTGLLRASVGWWNDGSDLERLAEGLEELRSSA